MEALEIKEVCMYKPVLSIDVSKSTSYAAAFLAYGEPFQKPFPFVHSPSGTKLLINKLNELQAKTGIKPDVVLEATGNYSKPISSFFENAGLFLTHFKLIFKKRKLLERLKLTLLMPIVLHRYII